MCDVDTVFDVDRQFFVQGVYLKSPVVEDDASVFGFGGRARISKRASCNMVASAAGDHVLFTIERRCRKVLLGAVVFHFALSEHEFFTCVRPLQYQAERNAWLDVGEPCVVIETSSILGATVWARSQFGIRALIPPRVASDIAL